MRTRAHPRAGAGSWPALGTGRAEGRKARASAHRTGAAPCNALAARCAHVRSPCARPPHTFLPPLSCTTANPSLLACAKRAASSFARRCGTARLPAPPRLAPRRLASPRVRRSTVSMDGRVYVTFVRSGALPASAPSAAARARERLARTADAARAPASAPLPHTRDAIGPRRRPPARPSATARARAAGLAPALAPPHASRRSLPRPRWRAPRDRRSVCHCASRRRAPPAPLHPLPPTLFPPPPRLPRPAQSATWRGLDVHRTFWISKRFGVLI